MMRAVKIKYLGSVFFLLAAVTGLSACTNDDGILGNPGFDSGELTPWVADGCSVSVLSDRPRSGKYHLQLSADGSSDTWATVYQQQPASAGETWEASVYALRQKGVYVMLKLEFFDSDGIRLCELPSTGTETNYVRLCIAGTAPVGTAAVRLVAAVEFGIAQDPVQGYFDDASLRRIDHRICPAVENGLNIIRASQLPDGALRMSSAGDAVSIVPYFSNFAAMALLAANGQQANPDDVDRVRRWLDWYIFHQEKDGIIFDYAGTVNSYGSRGTCDSTDSYAATFLMVLRRYQQAVGTVLTPDDLNAAVLALGAIEDVMQPDGLTVTKPGYPIKYLMDNVEVYQGLTEGAELFESAGLKENATCAREMAQGVAEHISLFWSKNDQCFAYAADLNNKLSVGFSKPYPHGLAQLFALAHCTPAPEGLWGHVCETFAPDSDGMPVERWLLAAQRCADKASVEQYTAATRKALLSFTMQNSDIHRSAIAVLALIDGTDRFPDVDWRQPNDSKPVILR